MIEPMTPERLAEIREHATAHRYTAQQVADDLRGVGVDGRALVLQRHRDELLAEVGRLYREREVAAKLVQRVLDRLTAERDEARRELDRLRVQLPDAAADVARRTIYRAWDEAGHSGWDTAAAASAAAARAREAVCAVLAGEPATGEVGRDEARRELAAMRQRVLDALDEVDLNDFECWCPDANRETACWVEHCPQHVIVPALLARLRAAVDGTTATPASPSADAWVVVGHDKLGQPAEVWRGEVHRSPAAAESAAGEARGERPTVGWQVVRLAAANPTGPCCNAAGEVTGSADRLPIAADLAATLANDAIGLFLEYLDEHGRAELDARTAAVAEIAEGASVQLPAGEIREERYCVDSGRPVHLIPGDRCLAHGSHDSPCTTAVRAPRCRHSLLSPNHPYPCCEECGRDLRGEVTGDGQ